MSQRVGPIGQISISVNDIDAAERFYGDVLGLPKLYRFGKLSFFNCAGIRLFIEESEKLPFAPSSSVLYFRTDEIAVSFREMKNQGVEFIDTPHLIAAMAEHDLWMTFFKDPAGNILGLMYEAPKGYSASAG